MHELTADNHICNALPAEQADQLQQDDIMPAVESPGPNDAGPAIARPIVVNESDSDDDDSDEDDDDDAPKANYVDANTQWEANPAGTVITVQAAPTLACY